MKGCNGRLPICCVMLLTLARLNFAHKFRPIDRTLLRLRGGVDDEETILSQESAESIYSKLLNIEYAQHSSNISECTGKFHKILTMAKNARSNAVKRSVQLRSELQRRFHVLRTVGKKGFRICGDSKSLGSRCPNISQLCGSIAFIEWLTNRGGEVNLLAVYVLVLMGSSVGFYLFLYFISVGYACGILFPLVAAFVSYSNYKVFDSMTIIHSLLTIAWAIRAAAFFLYREYVSWPDLHQKIVEVNEKTSMRSKLLCWIGYSLFFTALVSPCLYRLQALPSTYNKNPSQNWGRLGKFALGIQIIGLILESVADYQKSKFKSIPGNRNQWCHVGLFQYMTFPNYFGEWLFWFGTYSAGIGSYKKGKEWIIATVGFIFISVVIYGAMTSLGAKHMRKYSDNEEFMEFQHSHTLFGPNPFTCLKRKEQI
mmetsp:Transcript_42787/g.48619  ORF Transcript_42787/g.48619 Transcript_42787/m.48619 type:complete len:426 (+) Transcript_42787:15-1292(+)